MFVRFERTQHRHAVRDHGARQVGRFLRRPQASVDDECLDQHDEDRADHSELLGRRGEDEVCVPHLEES
jgi:hypothetical protein